MGRAAFFVRTYGCPVHCTFCDAAGTWHPDYVPQGVQKLTPEEITLEADNSGAELIVVTGGEPAIFDLAPLVAELQPKKVHLETSGAFPIKGDFDWVTLSPKRAKLPLTEAIWRADEFKLIIEHPDDIDYFLMQLVDRGLVLESGRPVWLHPEWSKREDKDVLNSITSAVKKSRVLRAGWQMHKLYLADALDKRSRPLVPLGGDPNKGY